MSTPAARSAAARQRKYRARQKHGEITLNVVVQENDVAGALLAAGLSPRQVLDRHEMERAISQMLSSWARAWQQK